MIQHARAESKVLESRDFAEKDADGSHNGPLAYVDLNLELQ